MSGCRHNSHQGGCDSCEVIALRALLREAGTGIDVLLTILRREGLTLGAEKAEALRARIREVLK